MNQNQKPINLKYLREQYSLDKKSAAKFLLLLSYLEIGEEFRSSIGNIKKIDEDTFKLIFSDKNLSKVSDFLTEEPEVETVLM